MLLPRHLVDREEGDGRESFMATANVVIVVKVVTAKQTRVLMLTKMLTRIKVRSTCA